MDAILSSFCFSTSSEQLKAQYSYRMPPVCLSTGGTHFVPEYTTLLLFDSFYVAGPSLERVRENPYFRKHRELVEVLDSAGRLKRIDFEETIRPYRDMIRESVDYDVSTIANWTEPFEEAVAMWNEFERIVQDSN